MKKLLPLSLLLVLSFGAEASTTVPSDVQGTYILKNCLHLENSCPVFSAFKVVNDGISYFRFSSQDEYFSDPTPAAAMGQSYLIDQDYTIDETMVHFSYKNYQWGQSIGGHTRKGSIEIDLSRTNIAKVEESLVGSFLGLAIRPRSSWKSYEYEKVAPQAMSAFEKLEKLYSEASPNNSEALVKLFSDTFSCAYVPTDYNSPTLEQTRFLQYNFEGDSKHGILYSRNGLTRNPLQREFNRDAQTGLLSSRVMFEDRNTRTEYSSNRSQVLKFDNKNMLLLIQDQVREEAEGPVEVVGYAVCYLKHK